MHKGIECYSREARVASKATLLEFILEFSYLVFIPTANFRQLTAAHHTADKRSTAGIRRSAKSRKVNVVRI